MARRRSRTRGATRKDQHLVDAARSVVMRRYRKGWHSIGAALRGGSGRIYAAVNLNAKYVGRVDVCAEAVALGMAVAAGERRLDAIVAVQHPRGRTGQGTPRIVPPCGVCREMLSDYAPDIAVLMEGARRTIVRRSVPELLPERYVDP